jgi:enoyl-CoA hydratase
MSAKHIISEAIGHCGLITLDRPSALNALNVDIVRAVSDALDIYAADRNIASVVIRSSSPRAFCAGADIKMLYELGREGRHAEQLALFEAEYNLNRQISRFPKPYVALLNGVVMGGGVGMSLHGSDRIGGDTVTFAMPETGIGFFPDIGATHFLPRLPGKIGTYLGMTGARIDLGDVLALGLATAHVPFARFDSLVARFAKGESIDEAIAMESAPSPSSALMREKSLIDRCFSGASAADIVTALEAERQKGSEFAAATLSTLRSRSPTSLAITLRQMQLGASLDLEAALRLEFRICQRVMRGHDYYEGVRSVVIDKGHLPHWRPARIEDLVESEIDVYFSPYPGGELEFSAGAGVA